MGVLESKAATFKWIDRYELIDTDNNDKLLKLMSRVGESEYIGKQYTCSGQKKIREMQLAIDKKIMSPCPQLMKLVRVGIKTETLNCSQQTIFCLVYQKPSKTIKEESIFRKVRQERFSDDDILCVLQSCVKSLNYLREMDQFHSKISSSNIYINENRTIVLGDPWLLSEDNDFNQNMHGNTYPSPQRILYRNGFIQEPDQFLSDLFSLGLVLLELYYLQHMDVVYEKGYKRVLQTKLIERINRIDSKELKKKIRILLSNQPNKRSQILNELFLDGSKAEKFITLEKETFKKEYIKSMLITSQVKTVKGVRRDYEPRDKTIINRMDTSRNPSDISSDTIIEKKDARNQNNNFKEPIRQQQTIFPEPYHVLCPRYSANNIADPQSRSTFTFHKKNEPFQFQENDGKSISSIAKNQEEDSKDNIQLELFEHSRKYGDQIIRVEKKSQGMKSSGMIESGVKYYRYDKPYTHRADYNSNFSRNDSKNSTFVLNSRVNDHLSL